MSRLFVSYHYTEREGMTIYTGFGNGTFTHPKYSPEGDEFIELIEEKCREHHLKHTGCDAVDIVLINWKAMGNHEQGT